MDNIRQLKIYEERCFINSLLYQQSMDFNMFLRNIINIPLILISGILTILNSIMDEKDMKVVMESYIDSVEDDFGSYDF